MRYEWIYVLIFFLIIGIILYFTSYSSATQNNKDEVSLEVPVNDIKEVVENLNNVNEENKTTSEITPNILGSNSEVQEVVETPVFKEVCQHLPLDRITKKILQLKYEDIPDFTKNHFAIAKCERTYPEKIACGFLEWIYEKPFPKVRPDFLRNPLYPNNRRANLEFDGYNEELKIAVEVNGDEHYEYPNRYDRKEEDFIYRVRKDKHKVEVCDEKNIYLITVPYNESNPKRQILKYRDIPRFILDRLPERVTYFGST